MVRFIKKLLKRAPKEEIKPSKKPEKVMSAPKQSEKIEKKKQPPAPLAPIPRPSEPKPVQKSWDPPSPPRKTSTRVLTDEGWKRRQLKKK